MATVVITFFIIPRFYVCKMDADFKEKRSAKISTLNGKRWSMNSQRLEEIVAELMRPIGDLRHSFDTDLSALLEEYLTEAGLHALDAEDSDSDSAGSGAGAGALLAPNFAELALLLQQSASIYGRKVDCLYQRVLSISESLHNSTIEITNTSNDQDQQQESPATATPAARRKRKSSALEFGHIAVQRCPHARREPGPARPPPTLPRLYVELEPRVAGEGDAPLLDYSGEPIGLLSDFHVCWRLQNGVLVEELDGYEARAPLQPISLVELQAAIEAHAPPSPPPLPRDDSPPPADHDRPPTASTPLPTPPPPLPPDISPLDMPPPPPPVKRERKRKAELNIDDLAAGTFKLHISKELRASLSVVREFDGAAPWTARVVGGRARALLLARRALRAQLPAWWGGACKGFEYSCLDNSGFMGWSAAEAAGATARARTAARLSSKLPDDSDDDGFFEQSSLGDSDHSRADDSPPHTLTAAERVRAEEAAEWAAWRARVAARAAQGETRAPLDVRATAARVLAALPDRRAARLDHVLQEAHEQTDVCRLFLATLFLANSGNVEVIQGPPLALNSCSLRVVSRDARLYAAAADSDPLGRAPSAPSAPAALAPRPPPAPSTPLKAFFTPTQLPTTPKKPLQTPTTPLRALTLQAPLTPLQALPAVQLATPQAPAMQVQDIDSPLQELGTLQDLDTPLLELDTPLLELTALQDLDTPLQDLDTPLQDLMALQGFETPLRDTPLDELDSLQRFDTPLQELITPLEEFETPPPPAR